uniref:EGF-like domain-containing protein n=2 Tax=Ciona intestinalis TaxID=7719 RepID=F6XP13_CIOIN
MSRKLLLLFALVAIICLLTETHGWRRRRRRRRRRVCTRVNCAWKLGPCSITCGPGKRTYIKTRSNSCGGTCIQPAAVVCNVKPCPVNCVVGNWQPWGPCSKTCGAGGVTYRHGSILVHPKHGGTLCPALKQWKTCNRLCLNNGSFAVITTGSSTGHGCLCKTGYSGSCCEINNSFKYSNAQINIFYKTLFIRWLHHPYHHHHSHHCGDEEQNFVEGENQDGDIFAP